MLEVRRLDELEAAMLDQPQVECPVEHIFRRGVYIRKGLLPAGSLVIGHSWKAPNWNLLIAGHARMMGGGVTRDLVAPRMVKAPAGRKLFYAVTDVVWANVVRTDLTDVDEIEAALVERSPAWLSAQEARACLSHRQ